MSKRMSLQEYAERAQAREAEENGGSWSCPNCGCSDLRGEGNSSIESTRNPKRDLVIRRKRVCRHCGQGGLTTSEVVVPDGHRIQIVPQE